MIVLRVDICPSLKQRARHTAVLEAAWDERYANVAAILRHRLQRGQRVPDAAPALHFRALVSGRSRDPSVRRRCAERALIGRTKCGADAA